VSEKNSTPNQTGEQDKANGPPSTIGPSQASGQFISTTTPVPYPALPAAIQSDLASLATFLARLGRFEVLRPLGAGGMGAVFEVFDQNRNMTVALKTIRRPHADAIIRFKQEFLRLANLSHPNILPLYELIAEEGQWFFTMKLVEGVNILQYVRQAGRDEPLRLVFSQLASGVHALHEAGILHRDLKPSNVMVTPNGHVVVLDFGLTTTLEPSSLFESQDHGPVGTMPYSSPEQMDSRELTSASDWFSFGVMLFELLTGTLPYTGDRASVREAKQRGAPAPSAILPDIPEDLNRICVELLDPRADARPGGAEIIARLDHRVDVRKGIPQPRLSKERVFIGRQSLLSALREAFVASRKGGGVSVHLAGRSGVGKTALATHFLEGLAKEGAVVLAGRCYERVSVAYPGLDSLVDSLTRYLKKLDASKVDAILPRDSAALAQVFPVLDSVAAVANSPRPPTDLLDQRDLKRRAMQALRDLLGRLGDRRLLVLFVDDFQWADVDSAGVLADLLLPPDPPALLLLVSYRSEDAESSPAIRLLQQRTHSRMEVTELTEKESETLAMALLRQRGHPPVFARYARQIARESAGNPYFIAELTHSVASREPPSLPTPPGQVSIDAMVWTRAQQLPDTAWRLLQVIAVAGHPLESEIARKAAVLDDAMQEAVTILQSRHFLRTTPVEGVVTLETFHDRVRESVCARLDRAAARQCHQRLAEVLESAAFSDAAVIAAHYHDAGCRRESAASYEKAAVQAAEALAFDRAAGFYRLAIELGNSAGEHRVRLRTRLADALANVGRGREAAAEYLRAADDDHATDSIELRRRAMMQYLISGHMDEGLDTLHGVTAAFGTKLPMTPRQMILSLPISKLGAWLRRLRLRPDSIEARQRADFCWSVVIGYLFAYPLRSVWFQVHHLKYARDSRDQRRLARAWAADAILRSLGGTGARTRSTRLLDKARKVAHESNDAYLRGLVTLGEGVGKYCLGRLRDAVTLFDESRKILRSEGAQGISWELDTAAGFTHWALIFTGELAELAHRIPQVERDCNERGNLYLVNSTLFGNTIVMLAADNPEGARETLHDAMRQWTQREFQLQHLFAVWADAQIDLYVGDGIAALKRLQDNWKSAKDAQFLRVEVQRGFMRYLRSCSALACRPPSRFLLQAASRDAKWVAAERADWCQAFAQLLRACIAHRTGDVRAATRLFRAAATEFHVLDHALYSAAAKRRAGELLGGDEGASLIREADEWMASQGIRNPVRMTAMIAPLQFE